MIDQNTIEILQSELLLELGRTFIMVGVSTLLGVMIGGLLGLLLYLTSSDLFF